MSAALVSATTTSPSIARHRVWAGAMVIGWSGPGVFMGASLDQWIWRGFANCWVDIGCEVACAQGRRMIFSIQIILARALGGLRFPRKGETALHGYCHRRRLGHRRGDGRTGVPSTAPSSAGIADPILRRDVGTLFLLRHARPADLLSLPALPLQ